MADVKWIKITTDIFDDDKILLIESLPDANSIIVVWFKLLCLAGKQNNSGVFMMSNRIPYTEAMLATIFRMKEATVTLALRTFEQFGMIEIIDGVITIPNWNKHQTLDSYEKKKERDRLYQAERRANQRALIEKSSDKSSDVAISEEDIDIDKDKIKIIEEYTDSDSPNLSPAPKAKKPSKSKYGDYGNVRLTKEECEKLEAEYGKELAAKSITFLDEYIEMKGYKAKSHYLAIRKWVIDAVKEREFKDMRNGKQSQPQGSFDTDDFFNAAVAKSERLTAADSEEIRARAEQLKELIK